MNEHLMKGNVEIKYKTAPYAPHKSRHEYLKFVLFLSKMCSLHGRLDFPNKTQFPKQNSMYQKHHRYYRSDTIVAKTSICLVWCISTILMVILILIVDLLNKKVIKNRPQQHRFVPYDFGEWFTVSRAIACDYVITQ